jgi:hypothetical protein
LKGYMPRAIHNYRRRMEELPSHITASREQNEARTEVIYGRRDQARTEERVMIEEDRVQAAEE